MKTYKAILALLLIAALFAALLTACADSGNGSGEGSPSGTGETTGTDSGKIDYGVEDGDEVTDIEIYVVQFSGTTSEYERVQDAINAISEPEIGIHVTLHVFEAGDYPTQLGLMMSGGENVDLAYMTFASAGYSSLYSNQQMMDISGLLDEYAPELKATMGEYLNTYAIDGGIYGLPPYRAYNSTSYMIMRKDILEELDLLDFAQNMSTWAEVETLFDAVKQTHPELYPTGGSLIVQDTIPCGEAFSDTISYDRLGDQLYLIYADASGEGTVRCLYEQDSWTQALQRMADWMEKGYIWPDSLFSEEYADNLVKQNAVFCIFQPSELGVEAAKTASCGYEMLCLPTAQLVVTSANVQKFGVFVPAVSDEPEAAVKFLNLWYTDSRISNLLAWGEEGVDYVVENGEATYPAGVEASTVGFHSHDFLAGNQMLVTPWSGSGADLREVAMQSLASAQTSAYLGFTFDSSEYATLVAGLTSIYDEYHRMLTCGGYTEEGRKAYLDKLYSSGLQEYIDAYQTQLDAWCAAN